ncbi:MAG: hypothetical protein JST58_15035 [Bacteroidetes bacterium]|nr:hypothetical protein [Bacteroidota bacterium]
MPKFQVTIKFEMDDEFMTLVPPHRTYIDHLINKGIIDYYVVSMESMHSWITFTADDKNEVEGYLLKSPLHKYWDYQIDELFVVDGNQYRLPGVQLN